MTIQASTCMFGFYSLIFSLYVEFLFPVTELCVFYFRELHSNMRCIRLIWPCSGI
jgi:hypothetical protein